MKHNLTIRNFLLFPVISFSLHLRTLIYNTLDLCSPASVFKEGDSYKIPN